MAEQEDEFGIPIRKKQDTAVDEFGIPIKKKASSEPVISGSATPSLPNQFQNGALEQSNLIGGNNNVPRTAVTPVTDAFEQARIAKENNLIPSLKQIGSVNQQQRAQQPEKPKQTRGIFDQIQQGMYLPAFNQGFNDLVIKPMAGGTDLIDRTIDKVYSGITGEKTPEWLRKKGAFDKAANFYNREYQKRDKPSNIVSETAEGVIGTLPLMAAMATGGGEANLLSKTPQLSTKLIKLFATTKAATAYKDATDENKDYIQSLDAASTGAMEGAMEGLALEAQMLVGGALGKKVANKLAEKGLLKGGKAAEAVMHALGVGTVFGGTSAGSDLMNGRDIDTHEAMKQFGMGLAFEIPGVVKGIHGEVKNAVDNRKLNNSALQIASTSNAASNLHAESVLRTLVDTPKDQLLAINGNIGEGHDALYANSIEQGAKAYEAKSPEEKRAFYTDQLALKTQGDVKFIADRLQKDPQKFIEEINNSDEISPEDKIALTDKVIALRTQQTDLSPKTNQAPDAVVTPERVAAAKAPTQAPVITPAELKAQNAETDAKIAEFQQKFPEAQIDVMEDLPESVVRTFDRVENDVPTAPTAINEASDWLYSKYKQLSAMKRSDTRRLTTEQIDAMQEQLGADIELLENHKLKYHGEETARPETKAVETKPAEPIVGSANESPRSAEPVKTKVDAKENVSPPVEVSLPKETPLDADTKKADVSQKPAEVVGDTNKLSPERQKAIDAVRHGIVLVGTEKAGETAARIDFGMTAKDKRKAFADIAKGNYETAPARKVLDKIEEFEPQGTFAETQQSSHRSPHFALSIQRV